MLYIVYYLGYGKMIASLIFEVVMFLIGIASIVYGIFYNDPMLIGYGNFLLIGLCYKELILLKDGRAKRR